MNLPPPKFWKNFRLPENKTGLKTVVMATTVQDVIVLDNLPMTSIVNILSARIIGIDSYKIRIQDSIFKTDFKFDLLK
jgi:hypothetical protein